MISPEKFVFQPDDAETIEYSDAIKYKYYYRLLQEIDHNTLIVINECLRTQNRYDLTYNCIRNYLNQTHHQIIFQNLPLIDTFNDFMILFDFDTRSRWKRESFRRELLAECKIVNRIRPITISPIITKANTQTHAIYQKKKRKLIDEIGLKDPHTIPRNLYLIGGKTRQRLVRADVNYVGRNNRLKIPTLKTYREKLFPPDNTVFELPHNFIDFSDFITLSGQVDFEVLVTDLKVDQWYLDRYQKWAERIENARSVLQQ